MRQYILIFLLIFAATMVALWVAPPFGSFALADQ